MQIVARWLTDGASQPSYGNKNENGNKNNEGADMGIGFGKSSSKGKSAQFATDEGGERANLKSGASKNIESRSANGTGSTGEYMEVTDEEDQMNMSS